MKKKITAVTATALTTAMIAAAPAMAQDGGDANLAQEQNNAAFGGTSVAAAGNNFSAQNQEASNSAETNVFQGQAAGVEQNAASTAYADKYKSYAGSGDIFQFAGIEFGDQSADVETNQANFQNQENTQTATGNTATADSSANAEADQTGTATGGDGGDDNSVDDGDDTADEVA